MWVCLCEAVTSTVICDAIESGARSVKEIGKITGAGTDCNKCTRTIRLLIEQHCGEPEPEKKQSNWRTR
jgi:bacterioferritin-associated ferredoxin